MLRGITVLEVLMGVAVVAVRTLGAGFADGSLSAAIATSANTVGNSNLVEICMLTHTSASRSRAWILSGERSVYVANSQAKNFWTTARREWIT